MLYDKYYNLTADPFRLSPDHRFSFDHPSYAKAKAYLEYALYRGDGFIVITGAPGTGKTTLIGTVLAGIEARRQVNVATLNSTQLEDRDLLQMVAAAFGLRGRDETKASLLLDLQQFLIQHGHKGRRAVLIVDEAQGLSRGAMEELRQLANLQLKDRLLLQIFLVGQEALGELVQAPGMEQLNQRIVAASHLEPLDLEETLTYIEHRLKRVAWRGDPKLSGSAVRLIHRYSGGVPRRINLICSRLFLHGGMEEKHELVAADVRSVIEGLQHEHLLAQDATKSTEADAPEAETDSDADFALPRKNDSIGEPAPDASPQPAVSEEDVTLRDPVVQRHAVGADGDARPALEPRRQDALGRVVTALEEKRDAITPPSPGGPRKAQATPAPDATRRAPRRGRKGSKPAAGKAPKKHQPGEPLRAVSSQARQRPPPVAESGPKAGRWALATLIVLLGGLTIAITSGVLDLERASPMQAFTRLVSGQGQELAENEIGFPAAQEAQDGAAGGTPGFDGAAESASPEGDAGQLGAEAEDSLYGSAGEGVPTGAMEVPDTRPLPGATEPGAGLPAGVDASRVGLGESDATGTIVRQPDTTGPAGRQADQAQPEGAVQDKADTETTSSRARQAQAPASDDAKPAESPSQATKSQPSTGGLGSPAAIAQEKERLSREAEERFTERLAKVEPEPETSGLSTAAPSPLPTAPVRAPIETDKAQPPASGAVKPSAPKVSSSARASRTAAPPDVGRIEQATGSSSTVRGSSPKISAVPSTAAPVPSRRPTEVPSVAAAAPPSVPKVDRRAQLRSTLLQGQWTSQGKPASLLPSDITLCKAEGNLISCWSVPRNIDTKYGEAVYKIEARLVDFSNNDSFKVSYRTLVRLVDGSTGAEGDDDSGGWQVSENAMTCRLLHPDMVSCRDKQGVVREYSR